MKNDSSLFLNSVPWAECLPALEELRRVLDEGEYSAVEILPMSGGLQNLPLDAANVVRVLGGGRNLFHNSGVAWAYRSLFRLRHRRAVELYHVFLGCRPLPRERARRLFPAPLITQLVELGVFEESAGRLRTRIQIIPYRGMLFLSDPPSLKKHDEYVYMGRSSIDVPELFWHMEGASDWNPAAGRLLDVGCGAGTVGIGVASRFEEVVGTDIVERCLSFAKLNSALNGVGNCRFHYSDVYDRVEGTFDVVATNPPCAWADPQLEKSAVFAHGGGDYGNELPIRILAGALERLRPGGVVYSALTCPIIEKRPFVLEVLKRAFGAASTEIVVCPLFGSFSYRHSALYRSHRISAMVRYVISAKPSDRPSIRFASLDRLRFASYKVRTAIPRWVASITRR